MQVFITPFGIIIMAIFYLVVTFLMIFLWKKIRHLHCRWWLFVPLILFIMVLPITDELWISYNFYEVCKDAGVHVTRKIEVEGFYDETGSPSSLEVNKPFHQQSIDYYEESGWLFFESIAKEGKVSRIEKINGVWKKRIIDHPTARYHYIDADPRDWVPIGFQLYKNEMQIIDSETGEIISRETSFSRYPSLVEGLWIRFFGSGQEICSRPLDDIEKKTLTGSLTYHTFIPLKKQ